MADISYIQKDEVAYSSVAMDEDGDEGAKAESSSEGHEMSRWNNERGGSDDGGGDQNLQLSLLQQNASSDTALHRQMVGRNLVDIFRAAVKFGMKLNVNEIMQPIQNIINDPEVQVRADLVEQLPHVAMICQEAPHLFDDILHRHLLDIIIKYLRDNDSQVRQAAQAALLVLMERGLLDAHTIEVEICPVVDFLSYMAVEFLNSSISSGCDVVLKMHITASFDERNGLDAIRHVASELMSKMAPLIGVELTERVFLERFINLCKHQTFYVRKTCAAHFGEIFSAVGTQARFEKLLPSFLELCCDKVWGVRKACVDVLIPVSCCLTKKHRQTMLADLLAWRLNDDSKWVRMSAFQILGPFISTFAREFTELAYNQYGELVFTNQQGNCFSIRYSYEGMFPTKCPIRNQMNETLEDYDNKPFQGVSPGYPLMLQKNTISNFSRQINEMHNDDCSDNTSITIIELEDDGSIIRTQDISSDRLDDSEETDRYNPFLYYYIPPLELSLDEELVQAARKTNAEAYSDSTKSDESQQSKKIENEESTNIEKSDSDEKEKSESNIIVKCNNTEESDESIKEKNETHDVTCTRTESENMNDTIDVQNLSVDKSILDSTVLLHKEELIDSNQEIVPPILVHYFVAMAEPKRFSDMGAEISHHCAFSFPAVALTLGKENWPSLRKAYQSLASHQQWKVRRTLASSIHEIAMILGEELTATDLVPIYNGFIKDLDEVRIGILKHLATFIKLLNPSDRCQYLPRFKDFLATDSEWNWRFREELATQLLEAVPLYNSTDVARNIAPLSIQLLLDKVAAVRNVALNLVAHIVMHLSSDDILIMTLLQELGEILVIGSTKWIQRQTFAVLCAHLIEKDAITGEIFARDLLTPLMTLSWDKVPNVRLAVARTLSRSVSDKGAEWLGAPHADKIERRLKTMRLDPDRDVRLLAGGEIHPMFGIIKLEQAKNIIF